MTDSQGGVDRSYWYFGGDELHSGQYVALIRRLEQQGLTVNLLARTRVVLNPFAKRRFADREALGPNPVAAIRQQIRGEVALVPIWAPHPAFSAAAVARRLEQPPARRNVLHTRQVVMGRLALSLKQRLPAVRVICELEGDMLAELDITRQGVRPSPLERLRWFAEDRYYASQERHQVLESDAVVCVSAKLRDVIIRRYQLGAEQAAKILVFPSVGDPSRFHFDPAKRAELRSSLRIDDRFVVVYSGNLGGRWQVPHRLVEAFGIIRRDIANAFFLVLTPERDRERIEPDLKRAGLPATDYGIYSCPHEDVVRYLCAGDVGLLLRDRHPANEVAAPGKFAEYMLSGLPIVMTEGIGDFSEAVRGMPFTCLLPGLDRMEESREQILALCRRGFTAEERIAQSRWAAERFSTDLRITQLAALYRSL